MIEDASYPACPTCGTARSRRSRARNPWDWVLLIFGWHGYRCPECQTRYWGLGSSVLTRRDLGAVNRRVMLLVGIAAVMAICVVAVRIMMETGV